MIMRRPIQILSFLALPALAWAQDGEWVSAFDGKTLEHWDADPKFWSVEDGCLTGTTTKDNPTEGNTFALWTGGETGDFELKLQYKIVGGNSGVQYRSFKLKDGKDQWRVGGYQADIDSGDTYSGILYGEAFRGILANRGLITELNEDGKPVTVGTLGDSKAIQSKVKKEDWNDYHIIAKGNTFQHIINGVHTAECTDNDTDTRRASGLLALQLHAGPPMKVQFRDIKIKHLGPKAAPKKQAAAAQPTNNVNDFVLQVTPSGGYVLRTQPLTESALTEVLRGLAEVNGDAEIRVRGGKARQAETKAARMAIKDAGLTVKRGKAPIK